MILLAVEATTPLVESPPDIGSEHGVCCRVTAATTTAAAVMAPSILWAINFVVGSPSLSNGGESGRSGALPAVIHDSTVL